MDQLPTLAHLMIAFVGILGSGLSVFVGVKVALAEAKKDIYSLRVDMTRHEQKLEKHIDSATHPTAEQVVNLGKLLERNHQDIERNHTEIAAIAANDITAHDKIEAKIDKLTERVFREK